MLIEFSVENFRSFREKQVFSMAAANANREHLSTNTFKTTLPGFGRFLRSAAIYGPNAAGKTNLLRAMQFMKTQVVTSAGKTTSQQFAYSPHKMSEKTRSAPSEFIITFAENGVRYEYGFSLSSIRFESEWLIEYVNPRGRTLFQRDYNRVNEEYEWRFSSFMVGQKSLWSDSTRPDALFLSTAVQLNSTQLLPIFEWFQKRLVVIVDETRLNPNMTIQLLDSTGGKEKLLPFLQEADLGIADLEVKRESIAAGAVVMGGGLDLILHQRAGQPSPDLLKIRLSHWDDERKGQIDLDFEDESSGTKMLFRTAGAWLNVFERGEVLLIDEIDTSLHPLLIRYLIEKFNSNESNYQNAQLIFSTHNTSLLSADLFRRDQIWFVEKDRRGASSIYPLTDFSPRVDEAYERGYLRGRYGALPILPS
ncbi:AAA family ATPase [Mesorhizobium sp. M0051]|uniref:AAA family ATPase n=1 Tax=unclassified Mesorhizobium TaxID=325217 RepID=UPI0003CF86D9|nr:ATP-binding protein [Mesorhizobium sp. LNHC252B00]ESY69080.1 hypothetical protein X743_24795 [Mesorhizobium sp. LNHC252B00]